MNKLGGVGPGLTGGRSEDLAHILSDLAGFVCYFWRHSQHGYELLLAVGLVVELRGFRALLQKGLAGT
jgi:hypothetical protein